MRSINKELGAPVNRFVITARVAAEGISLSENHEGLPMLQRIRNIIHSKKNAIIFDLHIYAASIISYLIDMYLATVKVMYNATYVLNILTASGRKLFCYESRRGLFILQNDFLLYSDSRSNYGRNCTLCCCCLNCKIHLLIEYFYLINIHKFSFVFILLF